jgi:hypothetical protein
MSMSRFARHFSQQKVAVGDLVQFHKPFGKAVGIIIETPTVNSPSYTSVLHHGHVEKHSFKQITFQYPGWCQLPTMLKEISDFIAPAGYHISSKILMEQQNLAPNLLAHLERFEKVVDQKYEDFGTKMIRLYRSIANSKTRVPLQDVVCLSAGGDGTPADYLACFNYLRRGMMFQLDSPIRSLSNPIFRIHSKEKLKRNQDIMRNITQGSTKAQEFYEKTRLVVEQSRIGITKHALLNDFDQTLISILKESAMLPSTHSELHQFFASTVLKKLNLYGFRPQLPFDTIRFLKEIGVWFRNEDAALYQFDSHGSVDWLEDLSSIGDSLVREAYCYAEPLVKDGPFYYSNTDKANWGKKLHSTKVESVTDHNPEYELYKKAVLDPKSKAQYPNLDPLGNIRVEITETVYTIDDPTAHELDDGISFEKTRDGDWVHIHIADPTSYIAPSSPLAQLAQLRGTSIYLPFRHFPMMPDILSDKIFNLGVSPTAFTFSARLNNDGSIADYKISPTILSNVKLTTYDDVDACLDWKPFVEKDPPFWVQEYFKQKNLSRNHPFTKHQSSELLSLQQLLLSHRSNRISQHAIVNDQFESSIRVLEYPSPVSNRDPNRTFAEKEPVTSIRLNPYRLSHRSPSHTLVSEAMIIAGRVAAKYCQDHKLPVPYRGQPSIMEGLKSKFGELVDIETVKDKISSAFDSRSEETMMIPYKKYNALLPYMQPAYHSLEPVSHYSMGIGMGDFKGYVKVTSPLRRYQDMLVHWQIQSCMLGKKPVFDAELVTRIYSRLEQITKSGNGLSKRSTKYWMLEYVKRQCLNPTNDHIAPFSENIPFEFEYSMNPNSQPVYTGYTSFTKDFKDKEQMQVTIPSLGGLRGRCIPKYNSTEELIHVVVEKVSPIKGFILFKQI